MIYSEIVKRRNNGWLEDFCRLYILLGLPEFLLPNKLGLAHCELFSVVDDVGKLGMYN